MKRRIHSYAPDESAPPECLSKLPATVFIPLDAAINRCDMQAVVMPGEKVAFASPLAQGEHLVAHAPIAGRVDRVDADGIVLRREDADAVAGVDLHPGKIESAAAMPGFVRNMGLAGMGGSMFPASIKLAAAARQTVHTLVVNAVECEPGIRIDESLLLHDIDTVRAGLDALVAALGCRRTVLAVKRSATHRLSTALENMAESELLRMPDHYPAGAEKLIVARLEGRMPAIGQLPIALGYVVFSVASLWALGRRLRTGEPSVMRPLTLATPKASYNLLVPVGTPVGHVLECLGIRRDPETEFLVAGGLMMGRRIDESAPVLKGTNAIFVRPASSRLLRAESPCILCGSCFDICPLKLHPIGMAERIRAGRRSRSLDAQLEECFLCGACSAVCPADIPLVQIFHRGKAWLHKKT